MYKTHIKEYDMYKAGEYIKNVDNRTMEYYKLIDEIGLHDEELAKKILRTQDNISEKNYKFYLAGIIAIMIVYWFFGFIFGFLSGLVV